MAQIIILGAAIVGLSLVWAAAVSDSTRRGFFKSFIVHVLELVALVVVAAVVGRSLNMALFP